MSDAPNLRNVAIIAHVDHGKTTLVDAMLRQSGVFRENQKVAERALDSNDLERERGITILAKSTSLEWEGKRINIVDTPGHADFGGEVERILGMVDSAIVLVDAREGPMPQTKFVLSRAIGLGLRPIVVVNKLDRPDQRADEVLDEVFDLFLALDASEEQLDFPILYASGRDGWADTSTDGPRASIDPLFQTIWDHVPAPKVDRQAPFCLSAVLLEADPHLGRILTGRIAAGTVRRNQPVIAIDRDGKQIDSGRVSQILAFRGLKREAIEEAEAGDIVALAGLAKASVADTIGEPGITEALPAQPVDPPTLSMTFMVNDGPLAGKDGDKVTSRVLRERLWREAEGNVSLKVSDTSAAEAFEVAGRGELQLGILIETMRREGYELCVGRPRVLFRTDADSGDRLEPIEEVVVDVDDEFAGTVVNKLAERKGDLLEMRPTGGAKQRLILHVPTRGLIGYHSQFLTDTRGTGVMSRLFHGYGPYRGDIPGRRNGMLIANAPGTAVAYALVNLEDRGHLIIGSGEAVYQGMIVGEHSRENDLEVNVLKAKQLTNFRAAGKDDAVKLSPPMAMPLEKALSYINDDELVEVTPKALRLRKRLLDPHERKRFDRQRAAG
ncbi:MAG: translational GTPase TypA [Pseudomonadota bacterium]